MLLRLFRALMPKEEAFVAHFEEHSKNIVVAAEALRGIIAGTTKFDEAFRTICEREGAADDITRTTLEAIHRTFITPFDRSEIHDLITALDDVLDLIEEIVQRMAIYEISSFAPQMLALADAIRDCAMLIRSAMPLLGEISRNAAALTDICGQIYVLEGRADAVLRDGLRALMKAGGDPVALMTRKEIYELLEGAVDRCQDVADVVQSIVIEYV